MSEIINCPSGLSGRIRGMKVREERVLADRKLATPAHIAGAAQNARTAGRSTSYSAPAGRRRSTPDPTTSERRSSTGARCSRGDRFYALLQIRALTYGPEYAFAVNCGSDGCRARIEWEFDLRELPCRPLSEESRAAFSDGNRFETVLPDAGKRVWFRLLTGSDERRLPQLRRSAGDKLLSAMLAFRVSEVEGVEARERRKFIEELTMRDADFLVDEFDRVDCGVDTAIEIECPECFATQEIDLPFERTFFMPGRERAARRRDRGSSFLG